MTDFFSSTRWAMKPEVGGYDGGLIFAAGLPLHSLERRKLAKHPHLARHLLDPQMYLASLNVAKAGDACTKLTSYGWFDATAAAYDSDEHTQSEWSDAVRETVSKTWTGSAPTDPKIVEDRVRICIEVQRRLGCEAIILPAPLATDPTGNFSTELVWLDVGLDLAARVAPGVPRIATVALSDVCVRGADPWSSSFLDTVLDQVTARSPEGAYLIIEQASHSDRYESHAHTMGALLRLVRDCKAGGLSRVVVPFAGVAGHLAAAVGAETWSTGWHRGQRRLRLSDFEDADEIRLATPTYYSHHLAGEIHLKTDLDAVVANKLLDRVADQTAASDGLLRALRGGHVVASVPDWEPRPSNVTAAREHFAAALIRETVATKKFNATQRIDAAKVWLDNAITVAAAISATGEFNPRTSLGHQRAWRQALERASV